VPPGIAETDRIRLALFGMQNRTFGPYFQGGCMFDAASNSASASSIFKWHRADFDALVQRGADGYFERGTIEFINRFLEVGHTDDRLTDDRMPP
jgi:hypothetical protein